MRFITIFSLFIVSLLLLLSCSGKMSIEESVQNENNVLSWTKTGKALTSLDIQDDAILNVLHVEHGVYGLIRQLNKDTNPNIEIEWYSVDKKLVAKTQDHWQYDTRFPDYIVASDGKQVIAIDAVNKVRIFNNQGKETKRFKIIKDFQYSAENTIYNTSTRDLGLLFSGAHSSKGTTLILRTLDNKIIFEKKFENWNIRAVAISPDKKYFAASIYKQGSPIKFKTIVLDEQGNLLYESAVRTRKILFDQKSGSVVFIDKNSLELIDLHLMQKMGEFSLTKEESIIIAADFSDTGILMIQSAETVRNNKDQFNPWQYVKNDLTTLNMKAEMIAQISLKDDWVIRPALWFDEKKKHLFYGHNAGYRLVNTNN